MAVALRGTIQTTTAAYPGGTSLSISKPAGVVSGDVIVIWVLNSAGAAASCTGFTALNSTALDGEGLLWRTADGTEGSAFTLSFGGTSTSGAVAVCGAFSGAAGGSTFWDPSTPAAAVATHATNSSSPSIAGFENNATEATTTSGDMMLWLLEAIAGSGGTLSAT